MAHDAATNGTDAGRAGGPRSGWEVVGAITGRRLFLGALLVTAAVLLVWQGAPLVAATARQLRDVLVTLVLAVMLAYIVAPLVDALCTVPPFSRGRTGRTFGALLVFAMLAVGLVALLLLTAAPLVDETARLATEVTRWATTLPDQASAWLEAYSGRVPPEVSAALRDRLSQWAQVIVEWHLNLARLVLLRGWTLVEALIVPVLSFYFVTDGPGLRRSLLEQLPARFERRALAAMEDIDQALHNYVRGQLLLCGIAAAVTAGGLSILGVKVFLTLGLLAGLSRAIPVIGPIVMILPLTLVCLLPPSGGPHRALIALVGFGVLNLAESKLIMPKVIGVESKLHPVVVITALLVGGRLAGILGMLVAVPIVAILKVILVHWREEVASRQTAAAAPT